MLRGEPVAASRLFTGKLSEVFGGPGVAEGTVEDR
jgi:hypothetical protein